LDYSPLMVSKLKRFRDCGKQKTAHWTDGHGKKIWMQSIAQIVVIEWLNRRKTKGDSK
jgi:hypothetical protein